MGWPDQAVSTTREYLEKTSKVQVEMIDQIMDGWKQKLKSATAPMAFPGSFTGQVPGAMPEFSAFAPWNLWLQAAEMWQRTWMAELFSPQRYALALASARASLVALSPTKAILCAIPVLGECDPQFGRRWHLFQAASGGGGLLPAR